MSRINTIEGRTRNRAPTHGHIRARRNEHIDHRTALIARDMTDPSHRRIQRRRMSRPRPRHKTKQPRPARDGSGVAVAEVGGDGSGGGVGNNDDFEALLEGGRTWSTAVILRADFERLDRV